MGPQASKILALLSYLGAATFFLLAYQGVIRTATTHANVHIGNQLMYFTDIMLSFKGKKGPSSSPSPSKDRPLSTWLLIAAVPFFDLVGAMTTFLGIGAAGGPAFAALFSSILPITAGMSYVTMGARLSPGQAAGVAVVCLALVIKGYGAVAAGIPLWGGFLAVTSASSYAARSVLMQAAKSKKKPPTSEEWGKYIGAAGMAFYGLYNAVYVFPRFDELVADPFDKASRAAQAVQGKGLSVWFAEVIYVHAALIAMRVWFTKSQFECLDKAGANALSLAGSLRTATVGVISHGLYCGTLEGSCMDWTSGLVSAMLAVGGVVFAAAPAAAPVKGGREKKDF